MELNAQVSLTKDGGLGMITLNAKERQNSLSPEMIDQFGACLDEAAADDNIRALLLRAKGSAFCSGIDLTALTDSIPVDRAKLEKAVAAFSNLLKRIEESPVPVVAAVTGDLLAGGVGVAGACDLVVSTRDIEIQLGEIVFGLIPANIMSVLVGRRVTLGAFRRLALTAERISADDAARIGMVDIVCNDAAELERELRKIFKQLFRMHPGAISRLKSLLAIHRATDPAVSEASRSALTDLASDPTTLESIRELDDGGTPPWFGRFRPAASLLLAEEEV